MVTHHLLKNNSVLNTFIKEIRDQSIQKDAMRFRRNIERIGEILSYELSKELNYSKEKKYSVLYMHDGQMLFDASSTWNKQEWKVDEIVSSLMHSGKIKNTIVVAIWNHSDIRHSDYFPNKPFKTLSDEFLNNLTKKKLFI